MSIIRGTSISTAIMAVRAGTRPVPGGARRRASTGVLAALLGRPLAPVASFGGRAMELYPRFTQWAGKHGERFVHAAAASPEPSPSSAAHDGAAGTAAALPELDLDDLIIAPATVARLNELKEKTGDDTLALRVAVTNGGCSGFQYEFDVVSGGAREDDHVFSRDGATVLVDDLSLDFVKGATVDFVEELIRAAFVISNNPNADSGCGCGVSFIAKDAL